MSNLIILFTLVFAVSCSTTSEHNQKRGIAAAAEVQSETLLGFISYKKESTRYRRKSGSVIKKKEKYIKTTKRAVRGYFRESKAKDGSYDFLLLEYVNLFRMPVKFIASDKAPEWVNEKIGYLNQILSRTVIYKALPTDDPKKFELQVMTVDGGNLTNQTKAKPSFLILEKNADDVKPLEGAKITKAEDGEKGEIIFPYENDSSLSHGAQYLVARMVYGLKEGLRSTWRNKYLPGEYLGAYSDRRDVVLTLNQNMSSDFIIESERFKKLKSNKKRLKRFTNPKSAEIKGKFDVEDKENGIFVFKSSNDGNQQGSEHVDNRIGLFVDIFDATQTKEKKDVVELIIVNPDDPSDFLMYYEHPENGEGR